MQLFDANGQRNGCANYWMGFEYNAFCLDQFVIDTINYPNNIWQIGKPQKSTLNAAYESKNAIITDTINPYPVNDTSVFVVSNPASGGGYVWPMAASLYGYYWVESDSLNDFGTIEFSPNNGSTWIDLINDTVFNLYWYSGKPILTGNSGGWKNFKVDLVPIAMAYDIDYNDTIKFRFSFFTDSIADTLGGLMFDEFLFEDWVEGIRDEKQNSELKIYPNPVNNQLYTNTLFEEYNIIDMLGNSVRSGSVNPLNDFEINTSDLKNGSYILSIIDPNHKSEHRELFIINH